MKKVWRMLLLAGVFTVLLCVSALAADTVTGSGFYDIGTVSNVKITPAASSGEVTKTSANVDAAKEGYETFYAGSDKLTVTYNGTVETGDQFVVMLVTGEGLPTAANTICYIDQKAGGTGNVEFDVYPMLPATTGKMTLFITSDREGFGKVEVPLNYAVSGNYEKAPYKPGDVNGDKLIGPDDALLVLQAVAHLVQLQGDAELAANVDGDKLISSNDALYILQAVAHIREL